MPAHDHRCDVFANFANGVGEPSRGRLALCQPAGSDERLVVEGAVVAYVLALGGEKLRVGVLLGLSGGAAILESLRLLFVHILCLLPVGIGKRGVLAAGNEQRDRFEDTLLSPQLVRASYNGSRNGCPPRRGHAADCAPELAHPLWAHSNYTPAR